MVSGCIFPAPTLDDIALSELRAGSSHIRIPIQRAILITITSLKEMENFGGLVRFRIKIIVENSRGATSAGNDTGLKYAERILPVT